MWPSRCFGRRPVLSSRNRAVDCSAANRLQGASLRYFNAAGATEQRRERHEPETHLIPLALQAAAHGSPLEVFGTDYPTSDGTAIRDYVHIDDLGVAHALAIEYLGDGGAGLALNLGVGRGSSVREAIAAVENVAGRPLDTQDSPRREGDPAVLVADPVKASPVLDWQLQRTDIEEIVDSAWQWVSREIP